MGALSKSYKKILFDMDGVITSERQYWNTAALTVYEMMNKEIDAENLENRAEEIKNLVFCNERTISNLKLRGVNTNWDLAYIVYLIGMTGRSKDIPDSEIYDYICRTCEEIPVNAPELYVYVINSVRKTYDFDLDFLKRHGTLWTRIQEVFQEWYLGDELYTEVYGKPPEKPMNKRGMILNEEPMFPIKKVEQFLKGLTDSGTVLGVGTGRSRYEIVLPLKKWGLIKYFDENSFVTYDDITEFEKNSESDVSLVKPHPFVFLMGAYGKEGFDLEKAGQELNGSDYLVVGDAVCDLTAAKAAGMDFAAVLTGVDNTAARSQFESLYSDYIFDNVLEIEPVRSE